MSAALPLVAMALALMGDPPAARAAASPTKLAEPAPYRIGTEDVLQIAVWKNEALTRTVPVRPDGMISLPLVNDVRAAGLTPMELRDVLVAKLGEYAASPEVSVIVTEVRSFKVSVVGAVARPGRYDTRTWVTVLDALAMAGGFTEYADRSRVVVLRTESGGPRRIPFDYGKLNRDDGAAANFQLHPGDIVVVP